MGSAAAPGGRHGAAGERFQQRPRVGVGKRQHGNLGDGDGLAQRQPPGVLGGADAGSQRVAGIDHHVHHAAALHAVPGAHGAGGENQAGGIAVIARIGIDQAAHGPVLGGHLGFDAAPGAAVAGDHNRALHRNTHAVEFLVVGGHAVIHVDQRRRDVAIGRVGVVSGELLGALRGGRVYGDGRLLAARP